MRRYAVVVAVVVCISSLGVGGQSAYAGGTADGWTDGNGVGSQTTSSSDAPASGGHGGKGSDIVCHYTAFDPEQIQWLNQNLDSSLLNSGNGQGDSYNLICNDSSGNIVSVTTGTPPTAPSPNDLARQAFDYQSLPLPGIVLNPPNNRMQIVNLETWLGVSAADWRNVTAQVSQAGITVTTTATPTAVAWTTGDGGQVVCQGPGVVYDASKPSGPQHTDCSHTYSKTSADQPSGTFTITASVNWHVTWTATGVAAGVPANGDLGVVQRASTTTLRVGEIQALNGKG